MKAAMGEFKFNPAPFIPFGYPHVERISTGIHDPLLAATLARVLPSLSPAEIQGFAVADHCFVGKDSIR